MQSVQPNIWNSLAPQQLDAITTGNSSRLLSQEEREAGINLDTLDELFSCGCVADRYLDASSTVH